MYAAAIAAAKLPARHFDAEHTEATFAHLIQPHVEELFLWFFPISKRSKEYECKHHDKNASVFWPGSIPGDKENGVVFTPFGTRLARK